MLPAGEAVCPQCGSSSVAPYANKAFSGDNFTNVCLNCGGRWTPGTASELLLRAQSGKASPFEQRQLEEATSRQACDLRPARTSYRSGGIERSCSHLQSVIWRESRPACCSAQQATVHNKLGR